jgi:MYXO-CTERM domain-containing protein
LDGIAESDDESVALLAVFDVDPWGTWPSIDELPIPGQFVPALAVAGEQAVASSDEAGATPVDFGPAAILAAAIAAFVGLWRRRDQLMALATTVGGSLSAISSLSFGRQAARALALLRMTLGIFRLW